MTYALLVMAGFCMSLCGIVWYGITFALGRSPTDQELSPVRLETQTCLNEEQAANSRRLVIFYWGLAAVFVFLAGMSAWTHALGR